MAVLSKKEANQETPFDQIDTVYDLSENRRGDQTAFSRLFGHDYHGIFGILHWEKSSEPTVAEFFTGFGEDSRLRGSGFAGGGSSLRSRLLIFLFHDAGGEIFLMIWEISAVIA